MPEKTKAPEPEPQPQSDDQGQKGNQSYVKEVGGTRDDNAGGNKGNQSYPTQGK
jgi:hypothetical protein